MNLGFKFSNSYADISNQLCSVVFPDPVSKPDILVFNNALCKDLGLDLSKLSKSKKAQLFVGNILPEPAKPIAMAYAGHQFGHFAILGDGRAILLGEHITPAGERVDIVLKGSGKTPYSRQGDGRATMSAMLREYIISEAMHALNIPTTRSLAVALTGEPVYRENIHEGAILTRVAGSHIRVGTFEYAAAKQDINLLDALLVYTIKRHYPELNESENKALSLLQMVIQKQADLIVNWLRVGFIHGVMNTDNMSIAGETIDYGPCAFLDNYNPRQVFSFIDRSARYAFGNQPQIAKWNLARFAESLLPLINKDINGAVEIAEAELNNFDSIYLERWQEMMRGKLGLFGRQEGDEQLCQSYLEFLYETGSDYTNSFRELMSKSLPNDEKYQRQDFKIWHQNWQKRLKKNNASKQDSLALMRKTNPVIIPRNHRIEYALKAAEEKDLKPFKELMQALKEPYKEKKFYQEYCLPPQDHEQVHHTFCGT